MLLIRTIIFYIGFWLATLIFGSFSFFLWLLPKAFARKVILLWIDFVLLWLRWCCGVVVEVHGNKQALNSPVVIVANHQSAWETFFLQYYFSPLSTILKKELLNIPFFGWGLKLLDPIAIDRGNPVQALKQIKQQGIHRLQTQHNLLVFPEGTRRPVGELGDYKRSGADIAQQAQVPIIAVAHNAGEHWLNKQIIKKPGTIQLVISEPWDTTGGVSSKQLMQDIQAWTQQQINLIQTEINKASTAKKQKILGDKQ